MLLDLYLFREWLKTFILAMAAIIGLLLLSEIYNELFDFIENGTPVDRIVRYYALLIPGYLPAILPIAFLVSLLFTLGQLQRNSEVVAMRAAGISLLRMSRPFWVAALVLAGALFWLNASLVPRSMESARRILETVEREKPDDGEVGIDRGTHAMGVFLTREDVLWFVEGYRRDKQEAYGVTVYELESGREVRTWEAARAVYRSDDGRWTLEKGREIIHEPDTSLPRDVRPFERKILRDTGMTPAILLALSQRPKDLSLRELEQLIRDLPEHERLDAYRVRYFMILASPFQFFVILLIALPVALGSGRTRSSAGLSRAVWSCLGFFLLMTLAAFAGERGLIPPLLSALIPVLAAIALGTLLFRRHA